MALAEFYNIPVKAASYHDEGNWFWNLQQFPGAYFDAKGCVVFQTQHDYMRCVYLQIYARNTGVRREDVGMSIADIPGYQRLDPPPASL